MYLKDEIEIGLMRDKLSSDLKMTSGGSAANTIYGASGFDSAVHIAVESETMNRGFCREMKEAGIHLDDIRRESSH